MHTLLSPTTFTLGSAVFLTSRACSSYGTSPLMKEVLLSCGQGEVIQVLADALYRVRFAREGGGFFTLLCEEVDLTVKTSLVVPSSTQPAAGL